MAEQTLTAEELTQLIEAAFAETAYPGDERLVSESCDLEVAAAFRGRHWRELPLDMLARYHEALFFFTPEAYCYYLPAFLLASALHYDEADLIPHSVVFSLIAPTQREIILRPVAFSSPLPKQEVIDFYQRRMERLTAGQRQAIRCFLEFMKAHHGEDDPFRDFDRALESLADPGATGASKPTTDESFTAWVAAFWNERSLHEKG